MFRDLRFMSKTPVPKKGTTNTSEWVFAATRNSNQIQYAIAIEKENDHPWRLVVCDGYDFNTGTLLVQTTDDEKKPIEHYFLNVCNETRLILATY